MATCNRDARHGRVRLCAGMAGVAMRRKKAEEFDDDEEEDEPEDDEAPPRRRWLRWVLYPMLLGVGLLLGLAIPYVWVLDGEVRDKFGQLQWQVPTTVYAQPLVLTVGQRMDAATLLLELDAS